MRSVANCELLSLFKESRATLSSKVSLRPLSIEKQTHKLLEAFFHRETWSSGGITVNNYEI